MRNIYIYLHCACIGNWKEVLGKIQQNIKSSGLYDKVKEIRCSVIGNQEEFWSFIGDQKKYKIIFNSNEKQYLQYNWHPQTESLNIAKAFGRKKILSWKDIFNSNDDLWEADTAKNTPVDRPIHNEQIIIDRLHQDAQEEDFYALYIHTKGVKRYIEGRDPEIGPPDLEKYQCIRDWVDLLLYFNVQKHSEMMDELNEFDVSGIGLITWVSPEEIRKSGHKKKSLPSPGDQAIFDGNFWWSKSEHIRKLNPVLNIGYIGPELWITQLPESQLISLWNSEKDHYSETYDSSEYKGKKLQRITYSRRKNEHR